VGLQVVCQLLHLLGVLCRVLLEHGQSKKPSGVYLHHFSCARHLPVKEGKNLVSSLITLWRVLLEERQTEDIGRVYLDNFPTGSFL